ncbi:MAG: glycosyltransferase [Pirellulales bacterium]
MLCVRNSKPCAAALGIADHVHFLGTRRDVPDLLAHTNVLALSSHMEANPVSILEGLACGKPVVATRVGSIPETVHEGTSGHLTPAGDAAAMAEKLGDLLLDRERAEKMGAVGRQHVVDFWSLERMVDGYQNLIKTTYFNKLPHLGRPAGQTTPCEPPQMAEI